jgi:serine/threonine protein kinase
MLMRCQRFSESFEVKEGDKIGEYILERELGRGVSASTWLAHRGNTGKSEPAVETGVAGQRDENTIPARVVLKVLDLSETGSWNTVDVFRREAEALKVLRCPGIPAYYEYFESTDSDRIRLVISMEYIEGQNLESLVRSGNRFPEAEVERLLACLADILGYLGSLRPPIVHRDVNPRNILLRPDGSLALVDFSGVQDAVRTALYPGATLVGTAGYIPIEQVAGKASHRSDLYGAAATAVFLLTGKNPAELPMNGLKIDIGSVLDISPRLGRVLDSWLDPDVARRDLSAESAARILRGELVVETVENGLSGHSAARAEHTRELDDQDNPDSPMDTLDSLRRTFGMMGPAGVIFDVARKIQTVFTEKNPSERPKYPDTLPSDSKVSADVTENGLFIKIPGSGFRGRNALSIGFPVFWIGFVAFWTMMALSMRAPFFFPMFSIPFWIAGVVMIKSVAKNALGSVELILNRDGLMYSSGRRRNASWALDDIGAIRVRRAQVQINSNDAKELLIETGTRSISVGTGLSERELLYLEGIIRKTLGKLRGHA